MCVIKTLFYDGNRSIPDASVKQKEEMMEKWDDRI
jgi:hypothetical protein